METELVVKSNTLVEIFVFIFGTVIGSFLNVCIYRIPREESIVFPPSHCTICKTPIKFYHNIPILSYFLLRGKCGTCGDKISAKYPIVELLTGTIAFLIFYKYGFTLKTIMYLILAFSLIVVTFIDLEHMIIPNVITFPGILVGLLFNIFLTNWTVSKELVKYLDISSFGYLISEIPALNSIIGIFFGGGILLLIAYIYKIYRKRDGMGMGDVKLLAMLGAFLGVKGVAFIIFVSSLVGSIIGISLILYKKGDLKYAIPFGPFLSLAALIYIFTGWINLTFF